MWARTATCWWRSSTTTSSAAGKADTGFLDRHPPEELLASTLDVRALQLHALAAGLAAPGRQPGGHVGAAPVRSGFRNNPGPPVVRRFAVGAGDAVRELAVGYRLGTADRSSPSTAKNWLSP